MDDSPMLAELRKGYARVAEINACSSGEQVEYMRHVAEHGFAEDSEDRKLMLEVERDLVSYGFSSPVWRRDSLITSYSGIEMQLHVNFIVGNGAKRVVSAGVTLETGGAVVGTWGTFSGKLEIDVSGLLTGKIGQ